mmetsp:Transcript_14152/g.38113  ORF Transcript_14152/g.38113 Transcript_14152/m.38113 type:complete len:241 (+) Transcript_14152:455-1177(+)
MSTAAHSRASSARASVRRACSKAWRASRMTQSSSVVPAWSVAPQKLEVRDSESLGTRPLDCDCEEWRADRASARRGTGCATVAMSVSPLATMAPDAHERGATPRAVPSSKVLAAAGGGALSTKMAEGTDWARDGPAGGDLKSHARTTRPASTDRARWGVPRVAPGALRATLALRSSKRHHARVRMAGVSLASTTAMVWPMKAWMEATVPSAAAALAGGAWGAQSAAIHTCECTSLPVATR